MCCVWQTDCVQGSRVRLLPPPPPGTRMPTHAHPPPHSSGEIDLSDALAADPTLFNSALAAVGGASRVGALLADGPAALPATLPPAGPRTRETWPTCCARLTRGRQRRRRTLRRQERRQAPERAARRR